jgi:seryl-tRNA synthetase
MGDLRTASDEQLAFRTRLLDAGLLTETGVAGVYARDARFEAIRQGFDRLVTRAAAPQRPEPLHFPPLLPRQQLETSGYLGSFPHLAGTVFGFEGGEREAAEQLELATRHQDWSAYQRMSDLVLAPAACYALYPAVAARGALPPDGLTLDTGDAYVFRREPSSDPARMQIFHMREIVRVGEADTVTDWRARWRKRATTLLEGLGLQIEVEAASDPFFGRTGRMLASAQREQQLKWELTAPLAGGARTAIASCNYHQDHFGLTYGIRTAAGATAHTGCMAFGEERVVLALLAAHGLEPERWPAEIRDQLDL